MQGCSEQRRTLLFLGDSLTAGDGVDAQRTFTALVERQLHGFRSINQGRSGWSTEAYVNRWEEVEDDFPSSADVVFVQLGADDLRIDGHNNESISTCINNMQVILSRIRKHFPNAEIVIMSGTKVDLTVMSQQIKEAGFNPIPPEAEGDDNIKAGIIRNLNDSIMVVCDISTFAP